MIASYNAIHELFKELDNVLEESMTLYVIGGAVLVYEELKPGTKDIDLIVGSKEEFQQFQNSLIAKGFIPQLPGTEYHRMNLSQMYQRNDFRIDIFEREVCDKFSLTPGMKQRATTILTLEKLTVKHCANEDIFLFKTMTEREGDIDDCISLARTGLDFDAMLEEIQYQIQQSGQEVWITWIGERMDLLIERNIHIPIMPDIDKLRNKFFEKLEHENSFK